MTWLSQNRKLLARFRQGDRKVLAQVYAQYAPGLVRLLTQGFSVESGGERLFLTGLRSAYELDDVLQETFLKAFGESSRIAYDGVRPFSSWIATIARNLLIDRYRRMHRAGRVEIVSSENIENEGKKLADSNPEVSPETMALDKELSALYVQFLRGLEEKDRLLVKLRFEERLTRREVSEKTGYSSMQVRLREVRLRKALLEHFEKHGWGESFRAWNEVGI